jgi:hypothetical protein
MEMKRIVLLMSFGIVCGGTLAPAAAQTRKPTTTAEQTQSRYQIGQMERVLEGAVEHGAKMWRDRFRSVLPFDMQPIENAKVRGFRLEGYGMVFDVSVPTLESAPLWSLRTLDQNDLGLVNALSALRAFVETAGDTNVQQALRRVELQVAPVPASAPILVAPQTPVLGAAAPQPDDTRNAVPPPAPPTEQPARVEPDRLLSDPQEAYRTEVVNALRDAMLDYSRGLDIAPGEWLVIAARNNQDRPPLAPADTDSRTVIIRLQGADLTAFLGGQISREEAKSRMETRIF